MYDQYAYYDSSLSMNYLYAVLIGCVIYAIITIIVLWLLGGFSDVEEETP